MRNHAGKPEVHEVSNPMKRFQRFQLHDSLTAECPNCKASLVESNKLKEGRITTNNRGSETLIPGSNSFSINNFTINNVGPNSLSGLYLPKSKFSGESIDDMAVSPFNVEGPDLYADPQSFNINTASFDPVNGLVYSLNNFDAYTHVKDSGFASTGISDSSNWYGSYY